jgi:hypothetical protein
MDRMTLVPQQVELALAPAPADAGYTIIYGRRAAAAPVSTLGRLLAAGVAGGCLTVLVIAAWLVPNPDGFGTHRGMGLAECAFLARTGLPCPACGMTTSFSWFVRGNLAASFYVQPMGCVLAALCGMTVWVAGYVALTGRPVHRLFGVVPDKWYLVPLLSMAVAGWGWKMFIHLHGIDGWR